MNRDLRALVWIGLALAAAAAVGYSVGESRTARRCTDAWIAYLDEREHGAAILGDEDPIILDERDEALQRRLRALIDQLPPCLGPIKSGEPCDARTPTPAPRHASRLGDVYRDERGVCWKIDGFGPGQIDSTETTCPKNTLRPPAWQLPNGAILETHPPALTFGGKDTAPAPPPTPTPCNCESAELR